MTKHILSLEIPDVANETIIKIADSSTYAPGLGVSCGLLEIAIPGSSEYVSFNVEKGFTKIITACDLELQLIDCNKERYSLPDGIYQIRYSVSPNSKVYVEYYHLKVNETLNRFYSILGTIINKPCDPDESTHKKIRQLNDIQQFINAAKYHIEDRSNIDNGLKLLEYARKRLQNFK